MIINNEEKQKLKLLKKNDEEFETIFQDIKERNLSQKNFPKLIIGTGLSIAMGVPGMEELAKKLTEVFDDKHKFKKTWSKYSARIKGKGRWKEKGLEAALKNITLEEIPFANKIREITSEFILDKEYQIHSKIIKKKSGFEKLLMYLSETVSANNGIIDIMTLNYDRIIEIICDKLRLSTTLGFSGNLYQTFNEDILRNPQKYFEKNAVLVRLFKPHGSVNWINEAEEEQQINDHALLKNKKKKIFIIAPGNLKYHASMTNELFRCHREIFNAAITNRNKNYSIFVFGYGFNDDQYDKVLKNTTKDVLVLTKEIKSDIIEIAEKKLNWTLLYRNEKDKEGEPSKSYMIYKGIKYELENDVWDINVFSDLFLG